MLALGVLVANRGAQHARLFADDAVYGPLGPSTPSAAHGTIAFLDARGVDRVMSDDWDLSWRIVFLTGERITAVHSFGSLGRLLRQDAATRGHHAVIVDPGTADGHRVARVLARRGFTQRARIEGKMVYLLQASTGLEAHSRP